MEKVEVPEDEINDTPGVPVLTIDSTGNAPQEDQTQTMSDEATAGQDPKDFLKSEYEALSGEKPDGRWSEKKLAQKIQELKDNK